MQIPKIPIVKYITIIFIFIILSSCTALAQQKDQTRLSARLKNYSAYKRKLSFAGGLQTRYVLALDRDIDINGKNFDPDASKSITNSFLVKRQPVKNSSASLFISTKVSHLVLLPQGKLESVQRIIPWI